MRASAENVFVTHNLIRVMPTEGNIYSFLEISPSVVFADGVFFVALSSPGSPWPRY